MSEQYRRNPFMDYRDAVPFMNLSGYIVKRPTVLDEKPAMSLPEHLMRKKFSRMVNLRRMMYCKLCEDYRNGRR